MNWKRKDETEKPKLMIVWSENNIPDLSCDASSCSSRPFTNEILSIDHRSWYFFIWEAYVGSSRDFVFFPSISSIPSSNEVASCDEFFQLKNRHPLKCFLFHPRSFSQLDVIEEFLSFSRNTCRSKRKRNVNSNHSCQLFNSEFVENLFFKFFFLYFLYY